MTVFRKRNRRRLQTDVVCCHCRQCFWPKILYSFSLHTIFFFSVILKILSMFICCVDVCLYVQYVNIGEHVTLNFSWDVRVVLVGITTDLNLVHWLVIWRVLARYVLRLVSRRSPLSFGVSVIIYFSDCAWNCRKPSYWIQHIIWNIRYKPSQFAFILSPANSKFYKWASIFEREEDTANYHLQRPATRNHWQNERPRNHNSSFFFLCWFMALPDIRRHRRMENVVLSITPRAASIDANIGEAAMKIIMYFTTHSFFFFSLLNRFRCYNS